MTAQADGLAARAAGLRDPEAYVGLEGAAGHPVEEIQTHLSYVFLVGERVVKLHKPVDLGFVDFSTRRLRNEDALREIEIGRRLSPDVYLGVAPVEPDGQGGWRVGALAETVPDPEVETLVVMRRLPAGRDALSLLEREELTAAQLVRVAACVARFHRSQGLGTPAPWSPSEWRERIAAPMRANVESLSRTLGASAVSRLGAQFEERLAALSASLERRRLDGRAVDGHGDLHLQHVWFEADGEELRLIDALAFSEDLRQIDAASEVAFLAMDLAFRGRNDLAEVFLFHYVRASGDTGLYEVVDLFEAYRAAVRAKVAALASLDPEVSPPQRERAHESAVRHLRFAEGLLVAPGPGRLVLVCGTVGSGKSSVARELARRAGGLVIASDLLRKEAAGTSRLRSDLLDAGLYSARRRAAVYDAMLEAARAPLRAGRVVILDATFAARRQRDAARAFALEEGAEARLVEVRVHDAEARRRLERRRREGRDPSDAGPEMLAPSRRRFEPPVEWPWSHRSVLRTDRPGWRRGLDALAGDQGRSPF